MELEKVSTFQERLRIVIEEREMTITQFANKLGYSKQSISAYLNGTRSPKRPVIITIAQLLNINYLWLCGYDVPNDNQEPRHNSLDIFKLDNIFPISTQKIPFLGSVACGQPIYADEDKESYIVLGTNIKADFCLRAQGDSMIGARIHDGDLVFVRKQEMVDNGEIAVVLIGDEATLKRVYYYPESQKLMLQAENPSYAPFMYVGEELDQIRILGKAVAFQSDVR